MFDLCKSIKNNKVKKIIYIEIVYIKIIINFLKYYIEFILNIFIIIYLLFLYKQFLIYDLFHFIIFS